MNPIKKIVPLAAVLLCLPNKAQSALVFNFDDSGSGVTASVSGSLDLSGLTRVGDDSTEGTAGASASFTNEFFNIGLQTPFDTYSGGTSSFAPTEFSMPLPSPLSLTFGFATDGNLYVDGATSLNGVFTFPANTIFTMETGGSSETLGDVGLAFLSSTPTTVWSNPNASGTDGLIQFSAVPEPSSAILTLMGVFAFVRRQRS